MVLVGPAGTGKTTLGRELAARTRRPFIDLDATADGNAADRRVDVHEFGTRLVAGGPPGGAVGDQTCDGLVDFAVVLAATGVSLQ
ncbi:AAA family ATPase [Streptomyces sp. NPDC017405]|uniref:AAA family ATPase n=1 Tax=unclassified Streptomyces TaxID=2593676 RepID=UPI0037A173B3